MIIFRLLVGKWRIQRASSKIIFLALCSNVIIAPAVDAATGGVWERRDTYAMGLLGLLALGLIVYLFDVVFHPERY